MVPCMQTGRTSSAATDMRSYMSTSTDSTWARRPSHGAAGHGDGGSASASPIEHAATMPGSQFAARADAGGGDSVGAASPGASADQRIEPRRGRYSRRATRAQAGRDAHEQGQTVIRRLIHAGGLFQLQQEMGVEGAPSLASLLPSPVCTVTIANPAASKPAPHIPSDLPPHPAPPLLG